MPKNKTNPEQAPGYKRKRGKSWELQAYNGIDPETGKKDYIYETFHGNAYKASKRLAEIITNIDKGEFVEPNKTPFIKYLVDTYLPGAKMDLESGTYEEYAMIVEKHIKPDPIARMRLSDIKLIHLEQYKIRKLNSPRLDGKKDKNGKLLNLSHKTVKNHIIMLKAAFTYACRMMILKYNPAQYLTYPQITKYKPVIWNEDQSGRFLDTAFEDRFYFLYLLAIFYSKRKGEIRGLRKQDIDLKALMASIRQSVRKSGYSAEFKNLKNEDSEHVLELEPWMVPFFEREFAERAKEKIAFGPGYNDNDLVFSSYNGNPVKERTLNDHFKAIVKRAGLPEIRFHDLRHTCITIMLKRGWSLKHAQNRAHHADERTTANIYAHVTPDMQRDVNEDMTEALHLKANTGEALPIRPLNINQLNNSKRKYKQEV